jgi:hypothetical protein
MKRYLYILTLALLAIGCEKSPESGENANVLKEFRAEIISLQTKSVALPGAGKVLWEKGDEVLVDNGKQTAVFVYNSSRGVFVTASDDFALAQSYKAVYPASAYSSASALGNPQINIPAEQQLTPGYVKDLPMTGAAGAEAVFSFLTACAPVQIDFPEDKLPDAQDRSLSKIVFRSADKTYTFKCEATTVCVESPLYVGIPVGTYAEGVDFDFTFTDNSTFTLGCEESVTVLANAITLTRLLTPWAAFSGGTGTEQDPYLISSVADVLELATVSDFTGKHFKQTGDIDMTSVWSFQPAGATAEKAFTGVYDGCGYSIKGVDYYNAEDAPTGLFRYSDGATIKNLKLEGFQLKSDYPYLGGFVGYAKNTVFEGCHWNGKLHQRAKVSTDDYENVSSDRNNMGFTGGIASMAIECTFTDCVFDGQISATGKCIGGITGYARACEIAGCSATAASDVYTAYHCAGAIAGAMTRNSTISGCSVAGRVGSFDHCGGVVGYLQSGTVENCVVSSSASIFGRQVNIGGIVGVSMPKSDETATINKCTAYCDINGQHTVGGIVGLIDCNDAGGKAVLTNCTYKGGIISATGTNSSGNALIGGLVGYITYSHEVTIENSVSAPKFIKTAIQTKPQGVTIECIGGIGGLIGFNHCTNATVSNCYTNVTLDKLQYRNVVVSAFPDVKTWGLAVGRNASAFASEGNNYYNAEQNIQGIAPDQAESHLEALTSTQMTDGTLLGKLNAAAEVKWEANTGEYPMLECMIKDPSPRNETAKRVSIIGDSISSFAGYIPAGYNYHYPCADGSVTRVEQTYWWQLIYDRMKNARLDINMSYSGTAVANSDDARLNRTDHWVNNSFVERYILLGGIGDPDIVVIHGGTNDSAHADFCPLYPGSDDCGKVTAANQEALAAIYEKADAALTLEDSAASRTAIEALAHNDFCSAYVKLLCLIKQQYPDTKIVCVIGDYLSTGIQKSIIAMANHYGARYVDLYAVNGYNDQTYMPKHDYNGTSGCHPNAKAMEFISEKIYKELGAWLEE